jgi:hypothetical protein
VCTCAVVGLACQSSAALVLNIDSPEPQYVVTLGSAWPTGSQQAEVEDASIGKTLHMRDSSGTPFLCSLQEAGENARAHDDAASPSSAWDLLDSLNGTCILWRSGWWTHELCHGRRVRQYHEVRNQCIAAHERPGIASHHHDLDFRSTLPTLRPANAVLAPRPG